MGFRFNVGLKHGNSCDPLVPGAHRQDPFLSIVWFLTPFICPATALDKDTKENEGIQGVTLDDLATISMVYGMGRLTLGLAGRAIGRITAGSGLPIRFGNDANQIRHAFRHINGVVDRTKAISAITNDLNTSGIVLNPGLNIRKVIVDGVELTFHAFKLPDGTINIGRITLPR